MQNTENDIAITGARVHNLKNVDVRIPRDKLVVITGLSGSGKSSLAFDTIFAEGQRRYMDTFSSYARGYIGTMQRPDVDKITGLSPVISIDQKTTSRNPRSTVGTVTEIYDYLRLLFARAGEAYSYLSGEKMVRYTDEQIVELLLRDYAGQKVLVLAPLVHNRKGHYKELFETIRRKGYLRVRVDGISTDVTTGYKLDNLYASLGQMSTANVTIFMDACFSGSKREGGMLASARGVALKAKNGVPQGNMVVFSAAQGDETAYPNREKQHGMFTYYLLKKLQSTAGNVTLQDLGDYITTNVRQQSIVLNGKSQTPCVTPSAAVSTSWQMWKLKE